MKFNPYAVLLTTGVLMLAVVLAAQTGPAVSLIKAKVAGANAPTSVVDAPSSDEARHPDTHLASVSRAASRRPSEN
ncbi:MAG: hypothetical protein JSR66_13005 [Proteobacteria bacterium]|nr:hypothetical protein [Pseudomonadota bacterium]